MTMTTRKLPLHFRLLNAGGALTQAKRLRRFRLDMDAVKEQAVQKTGLSDFGDPYFEEGLRVLLASAKDAPLHFLGHLGIHTVVVDKLCNRLLLVHAQKHTPEVFSAPLTPPLIVLGLFRSGTTHLHRLLAENPRHYAPPYWQLKQPLATPGKDDERREAAQRELVQHAQLAPEMRSKHFITADTPEECNHLLNIGFEALIFPFHDYIRWYNAQDHLQNYQSYRAWLQVLQASAPGQRLVLKAPDHTGALAALIAAVPEAHLVQIHRDPVRAYASYNSLAATIQGAFHAQLDLAHLAETSLDIFESETTRNLAARAAHPDAVFDVRYNDLMTEPTEVVRGVYEHYGLEFPDAQRARVAAYAADNPQAKHGTHHYALEDFGVSAERVEARLAPYRERFEV